VLIGLDCCASGTDRPSIRGAVFAERFPEYVPEVGKRYFAPDCTLIVEPREDKRSGSGVGAGESKRWGWGSSAPSRTPSRTQSAASASMANVSPRGGAGDEDPPAPDPGHVHTVTIQVGLAPLWSPAVGHQAEHSAVLWVRRFHSTTRFDHAPALSADTDFCCVVFTGGG
jgi:hypothetical protein